MTGVAWYHTIEIEPGRVTPGFYDCRPAVRRIPWPGLLAGLRCLDVGTFDGFWAFEMERRGAAEVVALDLDDPEALDWPVDVRGAGPDAVRRNRALRGPGFEVARRALGSSVKRVNLSVYDVDPSATGRFDLVFIGALLLHLRDPVGALQALRSVTAGSLVVAETIDARLEVVARGRPVARLKGLGLESEWWVPNAAALARFLRSGGFEVVARTRPFVLPFGRSPWRPLPSRRRRARNLLLAGDGRDGQLQVAMLARPAGGGG